MNENFTNNTFITEDNRHSRLRVYVFNTISVAYLATITSFLLNGAFLKNFIILISASGIFFLIASVYRSFDAKLMKSQLFKNNPLFINIIAIIILTAFIIAVPIIVVFIMVDIGVSRL